MTSATNCIAASGRETDRQLPGQAFGQIPRPRPSLSVLRHLVRREPEAARNAGYEFLVVRWVFGVEAAPNVQFGAPAGRAMIVLFTWLVIRQAPGE